jgi:hypothetical protein
MRYERDKRVVMTLDAGEIVERISLSARRDNLESFLQTIIDGF